MATPKYDKEAHAASLIKTLTSMGFTVTRGKPASDKAKTTTPLVSQRVGKANVPPMAKSSGGPITNPAQRIAAGSAPGATPARYNPFPNTPGMGGRVRVGPPGSIGGGGQGYSPMPGSAPAMPQSLPPSMPSQQMPMRQPGPYDVQPRPGVPDWLAQYERPGEMMPGEGLPQRPGEQPWMPALWSLMQGR